MSDAWNTEITDFLRILSLPFNSVKKIPSQPFCIVVWAWMHSCLQQTLVSLFCFWQFESSKDKPRWNASKFKVCSADESYESINMPNVLNLNVSHWIKMFGLILRPTYLIMTHLQLFPFQLFSFFFYVKLQNGKIQVMLF